MSVNPTNTISIRKHDTYKSPTVIQRPPSPLEASPKFPDCNQQSPLHSNQPKEKGPHCCDPFVLLVGRARFELATNGLKDAELCFNNY